MSTYSKPFDKTLLITVFGLLIFGIIMITSIGVPKSIQLSAPNIAFPNCSSGEVDCYLLLKKHSIRLVVGLIALYLFYRLNYRLWKKLAIIIFTACFLMLLAVLLMGTKNNTFATSWFNFYNSSLQPSEFAKLGLIFYLASWLEKKEESIKTFQEGFIPFCIISAAIIFPIMLQPDLGGTLVTVIISVVIYFIAGARLKDLFIGLFVGSLIAIIIILSVGHVKERFKVFLAPGENCHEKSCWQSEQANIAVGSGGIWGKGLTQGIQKSYWLPQASDDFIFAASAEELGFLRIIFVIIAYFIIAYRGYIIAIYAPNRFSMLLAIGITTWLTIQAFINIAVNISLFPITGITLPFISYGGSSILSSLIGVGILLNISKYTTGYAFNSDRRRNRRPYLPKYRYSRRSL